MVRYDHAGLATPFDQCGQVPGNPLAGDRRVRDRRRALRFDEHRRDLRMCSAEVALKFDDRRLDFSRPERAVELKAKNDYDLIRGALDGGDRFMPASACSEI
jgi:hypothetical protein